MPAYPLSRQLIQTRPFISILPVLHQFKVVLPLPTSVKSWSYWVPWLQVENVSSKLSANWKTILLFNKNTAANCL